jgi:hypothetical protein
MYIGLHIKDPLFLPDFNETWYLLTNLMRHNYIYNLMKVLPVGAKLFHADGQTDMMKLTVAFQISEDT